MTAGAIDPGVVRLLCSAVVFAVTVGCQTTVRPVSWDAVDPVAVQEELEHPTAVLDEDQLHEIAELLQEHQDSVTALADLMEVFFDEQGSDDGETDPGDTMPPESGGDGLSGTHVFVKISCPGPDLDRPDLDFGHGMIRVDGPALTRDLLSASSIEGDALIQAFDCIHPRGTVNAYLPAYYRSNPRRIILKAEPLDLEQDGLEVTLRTVLAVDPDLVQLLYQSEDAGTLVAGFEAGEGTTRDVWLRGANGEASCDLNAPVPECELL